MTHLRPQEEEEEERVGRRPLTQESHQDRASSLAICCKKNRCPQAQLGRKPAVCMAPGTLPGGSGDRWCCWLGWG